MASPKVFFHEKPSYFDRTMVVLLIFCVIYLVEVREPCPPCNEYRQVLSILQQGGNATAASMAPSIAAEVDPNFQVEHAATPKWQNQHDIVHVLTTRFMQMQNGLEHLGRARLDLFETFTLPSVLAQSTDEFLWLIFTDPQLHPKLLERVVELVRPHKNILLLGMNQIFQDFVHEPWVDQIDAVFAGDVQRLHDYQEAARTHVLLETRLDADDSIFRDMMQNVQQQTAKTLVKEAVAHRYNPNSFQPKQFRVFCTEHLLEWGYFNPWDPASTKGHLFGVQNREYCVTAGLSYAYQVGTTTKDIPTRAHHKMSKLIPPCNIVNNTNCIERIDAGIAYKKDKFVILRSRTPTSTAMQGVVPSTTVVKSTEWRAKQDETWQTVIQRNFAVTPESIHALRQRFKTSMKQILTDAIKGQCSKREFGCKESSIKTLNKLLAEVDRRS